MMLCQWEFIDIGNIALYSNWVTYPQTIFTPMKNNPKLNKYSMLQEELVISVSVFLITITDKVLPSTSSDIKTTVFDINRSMLNEGIKKA